MAEPQFFFSEDGTLAFLLVRPFKEEGGFTFAQKSIDALRDMIARRRRALSGHGIRPDRFARAGK